MLRFGLGVAGKLLELVLPVVGDRPGGLVLVRDSCWI